jgi:hypothetical protein
LQTVWVCWPATKTNGGWSVGALHTVFFHTPSKQRALHGSSLLGQSGALMTAGRLRKPWADGKRKPFVKFEWPMNCRNVAKGLLKKHSKPTKQRTALNGTGPSEWGDIRFFRKRIKPGTLRTVHLPLLNVNLGDQWPVPVTVIHGSRPGPCITILGGIHGDELTGPSACTHLLSNAFTDEGKPLDPKTMAGTLRIVPVVNLPGYRMKSRYFPDGRDLNRQFPGDPGRVHHPQSCTSNLDQFS